jgi:hypothetical protein
MCSENTGWTKDACAPVKEGHCTVLEGGEVSYIKDFISHVVPTPTKFRSLGIVGLLYIHSL